jgi:hypothetical protein
LNIWQTLSYYAALRGESGRQPVLVRLPEE